MVFKYSMIKKAWKFLKIFLLAIMSGVFLFFAFAILFSFLPTHPPEKSCTPGNFIYLNTNGVHVDFILPADALPPSLKNHLNVMPNTQFIAFGWGDRNFYVKTPEWSDLTIPVAFKALFLKSESAMHVTYYSWQMNSWKTLNLCEQQQSAIIEYIVDTFQKDEQGRLIKMEFSGYNEFDSFYEANGSFTMFNTCNVWVNRALKLAEVKTAVWTPFDFGVLYHIN